MCRASSTRAEMILGCRGREDRPHHQGRDGGRDGRLDQHQRLRADSHVESSDP